MNTKSFAQLLEENVALKLLLEEAHQYGTHSWNCAWQLKIADTCDCWYGKTAEVLIADSAPPPIAHPVATLECKNCHHPAKEHTARIVGEPRAACSVCNCNCMGFNPKELPS